MFQYLYIAKEYHMRKRREDETEYSPFVKWLLTPSGCCKIGVTKQAVPAERLRKLLVGNPGEIEFTHMWVGGTWKMEWIEQYVLSHYHESRNREWIYDDVENVADIVHEAIAAKGYDDVHPVPDNYLPYKATSYGQCVFKRSKKDTTAIFFEAKELASKI